MRDKSSRKDAGKLVSLLMVKYGNQGETKHRKTGLKRAGGVLAGKLGKKLDSTWEKTCGHFIKLFVEKKSHKIFIKSSRKASRLSGGKAAGKVGGGSDGNGRTFLAALCGKIRTKIFFQNPKLPQKNIGRFLEIQNRPFQKVRPIFERFFPESGEQVASKLDSPISHRIGLVSRLTVWTWKNTRGKQAGL